MAAAAKRQTRDLHSVLDKGFVRLVDFMGGDQRTVESARVTFGSVSKGEEKDKRLVQYLLAHSHHSPFEHSIFQFHVKLPIFVARQWMRHRIASYNEISARYTEVREDFYIPAEFRAQDKINRQGSVKSGALNNNQLLQIYKKSLDASYAAYRRLLESGVAREMARMALPVAQYTQFHWTVNARSLMNFLSLRMDSHAQLEIQEYANTIAKIFKARMPWTWEAFIKTNAKNRYKALGLIATLILAVPLARAAEIPAQAMVGDIEQNIKKDDIEVFTKMTGLITAQDTYDIYAPFDGRVEDVMVELSDMVNPEGIMARMVSTEMAALLDSSTGDSKRQTEKRWEGVYQYYPIKPEFLGIVSNIYIEPKAKVFKGDRLFTVAKKVSIVGKNTEKLYSRLAPGMTAELVYGKNNDIKLKATLVNSIPLKDSPYFNRLWLEVAALRSDLRIGEQFDGYLFVGKSESTLLVPRTALLEKFGRKYLIMEVETGLSTEAQTEILKPGTHFINPQYPDAGKTVKEKADGQNKKNN